MAEKRVSELTAATTVEDNDLFVMEQNGVARKVPASLMRTAFSEESSEESGGQEEAAEVLVEDIDLSAWYSGSFEMTYEDGTKKEGSVTFDSNNRPTSVTLNGHTLTLTLPEVE